MKDDNWEMISGEAAHEIEVLNYSNQVNVIEALVHLLMHHHCGADGSCTSAPSVVVLREFHRTATLFLLHSPGEFRDGPVVVGLPDGTIIHQPPPHEEVVDHLTTFFAELTTKWTSSSLQEIGAYALWMINWVHPFKNGNGRTARAFCYACISLKLGFVIPGNPTLIDMIMDQRQEYYAALKIADVSFFESGVPNLEPMADFLDRLLAEQLSSVPD